MARINERRTRRVPLTVTTTDDRMAPEPVTPEPQFPWLAAALAGAVAAALGGWLLVMGLVLLAWFSAMTMPLTQAAGFATQVWLAAHGGGMRIGTATLTVIPLGLTMLMVVLVGGAAGYAALQGLAGGGTQPEVSVRRRITWQAGGTTGVAYLALVLVVASGLGSPGQISRTLVGAALVGVPAALVGAGYAVRYDPRLDLPVWLWRAPAGLASGLGVITAVGAAALSVVLFVGLPRMEQLEAGLAPVGTGPAVLALAQLVFLPNLVIWAGSYTLSAGFTLGADSVVSPTLTQIGILPSIPVLGAVPTTALGEWGLAWVVTAVVAGAAAGVVAVGREVGTIGKALGVGAGSGLASALAWIGLAAASGGDLGANRLAGFGPRMVELLMVVPAAMTLSGAVAALLTLVVRRRPDTGGATDEPGLGEDTVALPKPEATVVLPAGRAGRADR